MTDGLNPMTSVSVTKSCSPVITLRNNRAPTSGTQYQCWAGSHSSVRTADLSESESCHLGLSTPVDLTKVGLSAWRCGLARRVSMCFGGRILKSAIPRPSERRGYCTWATAKPVWWTINSSRLRGGDRRLRLIQSRAPRRTNHAHRIVFPTLGGGRSSGFRFYVASEKRE
jgi:hypothetical protein